MRDVLAHVDRNGPQTVPQIARARSASRQHIQSLVNKLIEIGMVELIDNPAHKRSSLVRITANGRQKLTELSDRERMLFANVRIRISKKDLRQAAQTLHTVRDLFESPDWQEAMPARTDASNGKPAVSLREQRVRLFER
jgi:DNA-binding MarR family transcriptional regulator